MDKTVLICKIEEVLADIGQPDCKLIQPYVIENNDLVYPWFSGITNETEFMISSDKILTILEPNGTLIDSYVSFIK